MTEPSGHQTSFGRPMDVYMKPILHIDVHWTSKGRQMPTGNNDIFDQRSRGYFSVVSQHSEAVAQRFVTIVFSIISKNSL